MVAKGTSWFSLPFLCTLNSLSEPLPSFIFQNPFVDNSHHHHHIYHFRCSCVPPGYCCALCLATLSFFFFSCQPIFSQCESPTGLHSLGTPLVLVKCENTRARSRQASFVWGQLLCYKLSSC